MNPFSNVYCTKSRRYDTYIFKISKSQQLMIVSVVPRAQPYLLLLSLIVNTSYQKLLYQVLVCMIHTRQFF